MNSAPTQLILRLLDLQSLNRLLHNLLVQSRAKYTATSLPTRKSHSPSEFRAHSTNPSFSRSVNSESSASAASVPHNEKATFKLSAGYITDEEYITKLFDMSTAKNWGALIERWIEFEKGIRNNGVCIFPLSLLFLTPSSYTSRFR